MVSTRVTPGSSQVPINIVGSSDFGRYQKISSEKTYNMFITTNGASPQEDNYEAWLVNFPGYRRVLNFVNPADTPSITPRTPNQLPLGSGRGLFKSTRGNFALAVVGATVYKITSNLSKIIVGTISTNSGEVFIAENLNGQICIVDGVYAYIYDYNVSNTLTIQTDGALSGSPPSLVPGYVEYHNTFFLFGNNATDANGSKWYAYKRNNNTPGAADAIVEVVSSSLALQTKADFALAVKRIPGAGNNVMVFGSTVAEIWTQVNTLQTYVRNPSVNINYGCASTSTIAEGGNYLAWLAINEDENPVIMVYDGRQASRISTDGIDYVLGQVKYPQDSTAMLYQSDGHLFYQLTFYNKSDNYTLIYDFTTQSFFNLSDQYLNYHPARSFIYFNLKTYFISLNNASLYELNSNITVIDENLAQTFGTSSYDQGLVYDMQRTRTTSNVRQADSTRFRANSLVVTLEQGTDPDFSELDLIQAQGNWLITEDLFNPANDPIVTEQGQQIIAEDAVQSFQPNPAEANGFLSYLPYAPRIDLAVSRDGGISWSSYVSRQLHTIGNRQNILHWEGMGVANDLCFKFRFWGTYRFIVSQGLLDIVI